MEFSQGAQGRDQALVELFTATFTAAEGASEGTLIGDLVGNLLSRTPAPDRHVFTAESEGAVIGAAIFSRLTYDQDDRRVRVLGPVAVATEWQGQGVGRQLLTHAVQALREAGIDIVVTYGDPTYYSRVGFAPVTTTIIPAPFALQYPEGWLAQPLTEAEMTPLKGRARCVEAFNDPAFW